MKMTLREWLHNMRICYPLHARHFEAWARAWQMYVCRTDDHSNNYPVTSRRMAQLHSHAREAFINCRNNCRDYRIVERMRTVCTGAAHYRYYPPQKGNKRPRLRRRHVALWALYMRNTATVWAAEWLNDLDRELQAQWLKSALAKCEDR